MEEKKVKKLKLNINIIFAVYMLIALVFTIVTNIEFEDLNEIREILKYGSLFQTIGYILIILLINTIITIVKNIYIIAIFVGYKIATRNYIKDKLNKDDFKKTKNYYRDIIKNYSPAVLSYIDDFKIETPKDIVATLLQLKGKSLLEIDNQSITVKVNNNDETLDENEKYICSNINNNKIEMRNGDFERRVIKDAVKKGLIEETKDIKARESKKVKKSVIVSLSMLITTIIVFYMIDGMYIENEMIAFCIFLGIVFLMLGLIIYPMIAAISIKIYVFKNILNPYVRTKKGEEINKRLEGLKKYLEDYSLLDEKEANSVINWEEYLVYSVLFGQNAKIVEEYQKYIK